MFFQYDTGGSLILIWEDRNPISREFFFRPPLYTGRSGGISKADMSLLKKNLLKTTHISPECSD